MSESAKASLMRSILGRCRGARNSIEMIAVPGHSSTSSTSRQPEAVRLEGWLLGTAVVDQVVDRHHLLAPAIAREPDVVLLRAARGSGCSTFWMKLVPDFIAPMWSTTRFATPGSIGQRRTSPQEPPPPAFRRCIFGSCAAR